MTAAEALKQMQTQFADVPIFKFWADAIEAELKAKDKDIATLGEVVKTLRKLLEPRKRP